MNWRNRECLDRLAHLAERGAAEPAADAPRVSSAKRVSDHDPHLRTPPRGE